MSFYNNIIILHKLSHMINEYQYIFLVLLIVVRQLKNL